MKKTLCNLCKDSYQDFGLLFLRLGMGLMFALHGYPKIAGGVPKWTWLGGQMSHYGIDFFPVFWGFMASFSEFVGGIFFAFGLLFRPSSFLLAFTMLTATVFHISKGDQLSAYAHPLEAAIVFFAFILIGPGKYALDKKLCSLSKG